MFSSLCNACLFTAEPFSRNAYVRSSRASFQEQPPRFVNCNVDPPCLLIDGDKHWFFPDCVLCFEQRGYYVCKLSKVSVNAEDATFYDGKEVSGYHWLHSRVDGGQDRRFNYNRQIPEYRDVFRTYCSLLLIVGDDSIRLVADPRYPDPRFHALSSQYQRYCALLSQEATATEADTSL
jgi:hypothetical protein